MKRREEKKKKRQTKNNWNTKLMTHSKRLRERSRFEKKKIKKVIAVTRVRESRESSDNCAYAELKLQQRT